MRQRVSHGEIDAGPQWPLPVGAGIHRRIALDLHDRYVSEAELHAPQCQPSISLLGRQHSTTFHSTVSIRRRSDEQAAGPATEQLANLEEQG